MPQLSVVIITFNEEQNIGRCIASVQEIADEVIVVDSFSTDATESICNKHGVHFIQNKFEGYIEQKNFAATHTSFNHILSLDADEELSKELSASIRLVKETWMHESYSMNRLSNYCGKWIRHGSWYPDRKIRLFEKGKGNWGGMNPHDKFIPSNENDTGFLKGDIHHYSYYSVEGHVEQANKFSTIGAKSAYDSGKRSNILKIILKPRFKFLRDFILRAGFLDGYYGLVISRISAHETFLKYVKLRELEKQRR